MTVPRGSQYRKARAALLATATRCTYCGCEISDLLPKGHPQKATADHLRTVLDGGTHTIDNMVPACWKCNSRRGARDPSFLNVDLVAPGEW